MGSDPRAGSAVSTNNANNALRMPQLMMANILDDTCEPEPEPLLTPEAVKAPNISKATIHRCFSQPNNFYFFNDYRLDLSTYAFHNTKNNEY